jgi:hypothetical protein
MSGSPWCLVIECQIPVDRVWTTFLEERRRDAKSFKFRNGAPVTVSEDE